MSLHTVFPTERTGVAGVLAYFHFLYLFAEGGAVSVLTGLGWRLVDGGGRGGVEPGAVFACYADLCGGLVIGERRRRMWEREGRGRTLCALRHGCDLGEV